MLCSIQYRVVRAHVDDAFYELQNPREQIQAYVFDGEHQNWFSWSSWLLLLGLVHVIIHNVTDWIPLSLPNQNREKEKRKAFVFLLVFSLHSSSYYWLLPCLCRTCDFSVVRALVPRMSLDELFEQKGEVAKAVLEELEKVIVIQMPLKEVSAVRFLIVYS